MKTPVLFIIFNRLDTTKQVFEEIRKAKPPKLYITSDGPRENKPGEKEIVESVRNYVLNNIDWQCEVKTLFREQNLGCGRGPSEAITWFFNNEEMGIILEDDCVPSQSFFRFCEELLEYYKNDERIGMISGFNPFSEEINNNSSFFFSKYNLCWGWASWRRIWKDYDVEMKSWGKDRKTKLIKEFANNKFWVEKYWHFLFDIFYFKIDNTGWDAQFSYLLFKNKMLSIVPSKNLIENIGYNSPDATHTTLKAPEHIEKAKRKEIDFPLVFPKELKTSRKWDNLIEKIHLQINFFTVLKLYIKLTLGKNKKLKFLYNFTKFTYKKLK